MGCTNPKPKKEQGSALQAKPADPPVASAITEPPAIPKITQEE